MAQLKLHPTVGFDNSAKQYKHITALPLAAAMGAEIRGVQIGKLTDARFAEIEDALYRHKMIFFRDQDMSHADRYSALWRRHHLVQHRPGLQRSQ
jgi:taurine dioxygenase